MSQLDLETLLRQKLTLTGEGNVVGNDDTVTVTKQSAGDYAIQIGEFRLTLSPDELYRILAPTQVTITGSQVGVVGDHAHIEGGIHFYGPFARLKHWRKQHPWRFYPALLLTFLLILILGVAIAGAISPDIRQQLLLRGFWPRAFPKEREGEILVVIATFDYSENIYNTEAHDEIARAIETARDELDFSNLRVQVAPTRLAADDRAGAQALGDRYDASLVIWGADTGVRVTINFYNHKQPDFRAADVQIEETARTQIANPSEYAEFITQDLPGQIAFLSFFALGQSYYTEQAYAESAQVIEKAVSLLDEASAITGAAEAYFRLGWLYSLPLPDFEQAIANYDRAIDLNPAYTIAYNNRGNAHKALQDYQRAIADYDRAIDLNPQYAIAYNNRGNAYRALQDYQRAITDYDRAIDLNPEYAKAYNNRGIAYKDLQDYQQAIADYDRAIDLNPQYAEAYGNRGNAYKALQDYQRAIQDYDQVLALNPQDAKAYNNRGNTYKALQDYQQAIADYDRAIDLNPEYALAYNNRGNTYSALQDYQRAIADYDRAIALDPEYAVAYDNRGDAYKALQDYQRAVQDYAYAAELASHPLIYYKIARVYALQNQPDDACSWLEQSIALDTQARESAQTEPDFDPIRAVPCFQTLMNDE
jgi:tetratricopeptide (TPR) repeat protein